MDEELKQIGRRVALFADEARDTSPLYAALAPRVAEDRALLELLRSAPPTQRKANLLFAAVHDLLLAGEEHELAQYYPSVVDDAMGPDEDLFECFGEFCRVHRQSLLETLKTRNTQTNEVRRSAAFLPVLQRLGADEPFALVELGPSAGLNLLVDRYRYHYGDESVAGPADAGVDIHCEVRGKPPPVGTQPPRIAHRVGLDIRPLDVRNEDDARWLMACVWPEHRERMNLLRRALEVAQRHPPPLVAGDAISDLEALVDEISDELPICIFHSATAAYFTRAQCREFVDAIDRIGKRRPTHWLSLEGGSVQTFGTRLPFERHFTARPDDRPTDIFGLVGYAHWSNGERRDALLARCDMHGRCLEWLA